MLPTEEEPDTAVIFTEPVLAISAPVERPKPPAAEAVPRSDADALEKGVRNVPQLDSDLRIPYPYGARQRGEQGTVKIRVRVDSSGRARSLTIIESSRYAALDQQVLKYLRKAQYRAAEGSDGLLREGEVTMTIKFQLTD